MVRLIAALAVASSVLAGCGLVASDQAGFGVPQQEAVGSVEGERVALEGDLVDPGNGCLSLRLADGSAPWVVWPPGAEIGHADEDYETAVAYEGADYGDGTSVVGEGAFVALADLPQGGNPDSYFGSFGAFCDAVDRGIVVLDAIAVADA